jgi:rare lipoprotein A (peptidoglycan hydrolase)
MQFYVNIRRLYWFGRYIIFHGFFMQSELSLFCVRWIEKHVNYSNKATENVIASWRARFSRGFSGLAIILSILSGCAPEEGRRIGKYWHAGSERPYVLNGIKYYPQTHYQYSRVGYASWYGQECQGKPTATGRIFDKNKLTAAHRTLPLPSVVIVQNLSNGKRVKLLVNDRGPFADPESRIIDVSEKSAKFLNFFGRGLARVKVTCIPLESQKMALKYHRKPYPAQSYESFSW